MRLFGFYFGFQPLMARVDLALRGSLVQAALPAQLPLEVLDRVGDIDVLALDARRLERAVEEPPRRADKGQPFLVLLFAGLLAHQHHAGMRVARAEHGLRRVRPERAILAGARVLAQLVEGHASRLHTTLESAC
jgi:hypothetical protein